ncbi:nucleic acid-binding, OB-fold protein [Artemisia annua]|uniref:Nucleic acid-binding, OB-fold protein n=1 Tax=Artemisia annua TaxID=35608 RepID=A0A2U1MDJ3_ARTAN|nr:nucleic acid-binding, OB-fold protein [Artemisia annua]
MALTGNVDPQSQVSAPILQQRSLAYFTDLNPADNRKFIEARVYRKWTTMKVPNLIPTCFSCILLDKKGSAIQANADLKEKERFQHDLQINCVYRIQGFGFEKTDSWGKTLDNDMTLCFGKHTQIDPLKDNDYPYHYFSFAAYNELGGRLEKKNPILTDYIGYIHNVEKVKEYGGATGNKFKLRNIGIRNVNNNVVTFTLWNEKADNFEEDEYLKMTKPVVLAVSSCYLKTYGGQLQLSATSATSYYFNPPIEETAELLAAYRQILQLISYNQDNTAAPQLEVQTERLIDWEQERTRNRVALGTLLQIDPNTQQRVLFTQEVMILQIDNTHEWYYQKCDECGGKLTYGFVHGHCHQYGTQPKPQKSYSFRLVMTDGTGNATMTCFSPQTDGLIKDINTLLEEVADKSPEIIPAQILALENTRHVFQFRFAKPVAKGAPTFILQKVMDHMPSILPASTEGPSSPPVASTYDQSAIHSSPPPATPLASQETPTDVATVTYLPGSSNVRKELFTASIEEEINPEAKKQKTE